MRYNELLTEQYLRRKELSGLFEQYNKTLTDNAFRVFEQMTAEADDDEENTGADVIPTATAEFDPFDYLAKSEIEIDDEDCVLTLGKSNEKLGKMNIVYLSLPAGYTCPFAAGCKTLAHRRGGKFKNGLKIKDVGGDMRCYAANTEVQYPKVRASRWSNFDLLRKSDNMADLLARSIDYFNVNNPNITVFRIHESGDFFSQEYFDAWIETARSYPKILFYAYTKSLSYWQARKDEIPKNLRLIASEGGKTDEIIDKEGFRKAVVVTDQGDAIKQNLHIDVGDFLAVFGDNDFALLLHGVQSKESGKTSQSMANSALLKKYAKRLNLAPQKLAKLFAKYTR